MKLDRKIPVLQYAKRQKICDYKIRNKNRLIEKFRKSVHWKRIKWTTQKFVQIHNLKDCWCQHDTNIEITWKELSVQMLWNVISAYWREFHF